MPKELFERVRVKIAEKLKMYISNTSIDCLAVCLYFLCLPFTIVTTPFGSLLKLITFPVSAVLAAKLFLGNVKPLCFNCVHFVYSLYIIITFCGLLTLREEVTVTTTKDMLLAYTVFALVSVRVYNGCEHELIDSTWIIVGIMCTWLCLTSKQMVNEFENRTVINIFGFSEDPNQFCAYYIVPAMVSVKRMLEKRKTAPLYAILIVLMLYGVLKTGSRGGLVGILAGIFCFMMIGTKNIRMKIGFAAGGLITAVLFATVLFPLLPTDIQERFSVESVEESGGSGRTEIWQYLIEYTGEKPERIIRGSGLLSTYPIMEANKNKGGAFGHGRVAHNQYIQVFTDQGVLGLSVFLILICVCIFRNIKREPYISASFISVMAFSVSLTMYVFKPYINILMMCAMTFSDTGREENKP